ncbi:uncharacterized protein LOC111642972 [Copidosoma floridanum]|uniref:uncharacterized protein LOC111642972 n=1 Tax=Copidosoma floridanum TaxID=29053 RepID=UPI000C6FADC0|nr:uncharacterized protein LOC111642972 [Copidosoma floridanum]XP_023245620.1 uncharacterized protein LOC111642972 [Copidosoma floridanum]
MDDDGPLWSVDSVGNYWLMFPNKHALGIEEIREIFSEFGYVKNVTQAGNEKGLRFVQFTTLKDTERAIENLEDHPTISLRKHRPPKKNKNKTNTASNTNVNKDVRSPNKTDSEEDYKKNLFQRKNPLHNKSEQFSSDCSSQVSSEQQPYRIHFFLLGARRHLIHLTKFLQNRKKSVLLFLLQK